MAEIRIETDAELPAITAAYIADKINRSIDESGHCYCALSGGSSPKPLLHELSKKALPWQNVTFIMVDERFTTDAAQQNETMLMAFVTSIPTPGPKLLKLLQNASLENTVTAANELVQPLPESLDLVILGMGLDGHTASLFPDSTDYQSAMHDHRKYVKVVPGEAPFPRISMSYHWLMQAKQLILYIPGKDKLECLRRLLTDANAISPVKSLAAQANCMTVFTSEG